MLGQDIYNVKVSKLNINNFYLISVKLPFLKNYLNLLRNIIYQS